MQHPYSPLSGTPAEEFLVAHAEEEAAGGAFMQYILLYIEIDKL